MLGGTLSGGDHKKFTVMTTVFTITSQVMISGKVFVETVTS